MERSRQVSKDNDVVRDTTLRSDVSKRSMGDELSLYIEDDITLGEHFSINPGLRLSLFHTGGKVYFCPEPRLSMKTTMGRGWAGKLSCSRMSQYVHQLASGNISMPNDLWVPITRDIPPVKSWIVSFGTYYNGLKGWEFSVEAYWKHLDNVLEYKDGKKAFTSASNWEANVEVGMNCTFRRQRDARQVRLHIHCPARKGFSRTAASITANGSPSSMTAVTISV